MQENLLFVFSGTLLFFDGVLASVLQLLHKKLLLLATSRL